MPNSLSAKKRLRQNVKLRLRNRTARTTLRNHIRKLHEAIASGDVAAMETAFRLAARKLDQAAGDHLIHKNAAARTKSRLSARVKAAKVAAAA